MSGRLCIYLFCAQCGYGYFIVFEKFSNILPAFQKSVQYNKSQLKENLTTHGLSPVCQKHSFWCTSSCIGREDCTQAGLTLLTVTGSINTSLQNTRSILWVLQLHKKQNEWEKKKDFAAPCSIIEYPPLSCMVQIDLLDSIVSHTNIWRNFLRMNKHL